MTNYWKAYIEFLPKEKHIQSKKETFTVGIQQSISTFFSKIETQDKVLYKEYRNAKVFDDVINDKME